MIDAVPSLHLRALILTPRGRDAAVAANLLQHADITPQLCGNLAELTAALGHDVALVLVTDEAIRDVDLKPLAQWIGEQPRHGPICHSFF